jgi:hypothetical protein
MLNRHALTGKAGAFVFGKVDRCCEVPPVLMKIERRLEAIFAEYGASDPNKLPRALQREILQRAIVETAVDFPAASRSFMNLGFIRAWERMWLATQLASDAFAIATGVYAAVVLAGFGLPVAPFDLVGPNVSSQNRATTSTRCGSCSLPIKAPSSATTAVRRRSTCWSRIAYEACGGWSRSIPGSQRSSCSSSVPRRRCRQTRDRALFTG